MPDIHSLISPSYLKLICSCSKSLPSDPNYVEEENVAATHGTIQHALLQYHLSTYFGRESEVVDTSSLTLEEILEVNEVFNYIIKRYDKIKGHCKKPIILIEEKLELKFLPDPSWGYIDFGICTDSTIYVFDGKFGYVQVDIEHDGKPNEQLSAYGVGIYDKVKNERNIKNFVLTICQPKNNNYPTLKVSTKKMIDYINKVITPAAYEAFNGTGTYVPNPSCKYCKNKNHCRAYSVAVLSQLELETKPELLTDDEVDFLLPKLNDYKKYCDIILAYALKKAQEGKNWNTMQLATGKPTREFTSEEEVIKVAIANDITDIYKTTLLSVAQLEKVVTKPRFKELFGSLVTYKEGKECLVPKTAEVRTTAKQDFNKGE